MILFKAYTNKFFIRVEENVKKKASEYEYERQQYKNTSASIKYKIKWNISPTGFQKCSDCYINLTN